MIHRHVTEEETQRAKYTYGNADRGSVQENAIPDHYGICFFQCSQASWTLPAWRALLGWFSVTLGPSREAWPTGLCRASVDPCIFPSSHHGGGWGQRSLPYPHSQRPPLALLSGFSLANGAARTIFETEIRPRQVTSPWETQGRYLRQGKSADN